MTYRLSKRANQTTENYVLTNSMIKLAGQLNAEPSNDTTGVSFHERVNLIHILNRFLERQQDILAEEINDEAEILTDFDMSSFNRF
jgi:hypothetical protein